MTDKTHAQLLGEQFVAYATKFTIPGSSATDTTALILALDAETELEHHRTMLVMSGLLEG